MCVEVLEVYEDDLAGQLTGNTEPLGHTEQMILEWTSLTSLCGEQMSLALELLAQIDDRDTDPV